MLTNSRDIVRRLEREGWTLLRVTGSHHVFKSPISGGTVVMPFIRVQAGSLTEVRHGTLHRHH
jgi:predicted RNA binding protein YcfA (HicA-like mRNA interferase family)